MEVFRGFVYVPRRSWLHSLDPRSKSIMLVFYLLSSVLLSSLPVQLVLLASMVPLAITSRSFHRWLSALRGALVFAVIIFALNALMSPERGLEYAASMSLRFVVLTSSFSLYFLTTTPEDLALALESSGLPREYALMITMSLRFVPTLARDMQVVIDAFRSRGMRMDSGNLMERLRSYAIILTPLIVFEVRRSLMVAEALEARAFGGTTKPTIYRRMRMRSADYAFVFIWLGLLVTILVLRAQGFVY